MRAINDYLIRKLFTVLFVLGAVELSVRQLLGIPYRGHR